MTNHEPKVRDLEIRAADGLRLHGRYWEADDPRAVVVVAHGFGEHAGCYDHVALEVARAAARAAHPRLRAAAEAPARPADPRPDQPPAVFRDGRGWPPHHRPRRGDPPARADDPGRLRPGHRPRRLPRRL